MFLVADTRLDSPVSRTTCSGEEVDDDDGRKRFVGNEEDWLWPLRRMSLKILTVTVQSVREVRICKTMVRGSFSWSYNCTHTFYTRW